MCVYIYMLMKCAYIYMCVYIYSYETRIYETRTGHNYRYEHPENCTFRDVSEVCLCIYVHICVNINVLININVYI